MDSLNPIEEAKKEKQRVANRKYYLLHKNDPEFVKRRKKYTKQYFRGLKKRNPEQYKRIIERNRKNMMKMRQRAKMMEKILADKKN